MGGFGALLLASDLGRSRVSGVVAASAALWLKGSQTPARAYDGRSDFDRHSIFNRLSRLRGHPGPPRLRHLGPLHRGEPHPGPAAARGARPTSRTAATTTTSGAATSRRRWPGPQRAAERRPIPSPTALRVHPGRRAASPRRSPSCPNVRRRARSRVVPRRRRCPTGSPSSARTTRSSTGWSLPPTAACSTCPAPPDPAGHDRAAIASCGRQDPLRGVDVEVLDHPAVEVTTPVPRRLAVLQGGDDRPGLLDLRLARREDLVGTARPGRGGSASCRRSPSRGPARHSARKPSASLTSL